MSGGEFSLLIVLGAVSLFAFWLAFKLLAKALVVAVSLFGWAAEAGFLGVAVYFACWMFMFPVMALVCLFGAIFHWDSSRELREDTSGVSYGVDPDFPRNEEEESDNLVEAEGWMKADGWTKADVRRYEENKRKLLEGKFDDTI